MNDKISLKDIAGWQLSPDSSKVKLPVVQRGFVWKTKQVENLWDSLLREYPIGSFLLSKTQGDYYDLMDGQQRATSIFLGFLNPYVKQDNVKAWAMKDNLPVLWIDLDPEKELSDSRKYLFRLTTRSHPWGYQANKQDSILSVSDRRKALELFRKNTENRGEKKYTSFKNTTVFPYDAAYPLPFCFFMENEEEKEVKEAKEVIDMAEKYLPNDIQTKHGGFKDKNEYLNLLRQDEWKSKIEQILNAAKKVKCRTIHCEVISDQILKEELLDDNSTPTVFIRINSSGTPLSGDDLIYSIYKATFPEAKKAVESIGMDFISPTQVFSLVSRIAKSEINEDGYPSKMKVREFQQNLKKPEFTNKLKELIDNETARNLFNLAIEILQCEGNSLIEGKIPPVLVKEFVKKSPDLFLFLIYWLNLHNRAPIEDRLRLKIAAKMLSFGWFRFGNITRLWNEEVKNECFWEMPFNKHIWWDEKHGIDFILPPDILRKYYDQASVVSMFLEDDSNKENLRAEGVGKKITDYYKSIKQEKVESQNANGYFSSFIHIIQHCRELVLFAQRGYINKSFGDFNQMENIEDTNTPWDWDHIYPREWEHRKVYCNPAIKYWNNTNGNLRAISLEQNRSESNNLSPGERLSDEHIRDISFIKEESDWPHWKDIKGRIWNNETAAVHFRAVTRRMVNVYEKFWNDMKIGELLSPTD